MLIDVERLQTASMHLSDVLADPAHWTDLLEEIAQAAGAMGAGLLPHAGSEGAVASPDLKDCLEAYIREGWHEGSRGTRKRAMGLQSRGEVVIDQDLLDHDGRHRSPFFNEFLPRFDGRSWAGVGFRSGPESWCLALHRSPRQGQFHQAEKAALKHLSLRLNEIGSLSHVVGRAALSDIARSFDQIRQAAIAIDRTGRVILANPAAEKMFGVAMRVVGGRLMFSNRNAAAEFRALLGRLDRTRDRSPLGAAPIIVRRQSAAPLLIEALPVDGAAMSPFLQARALLLLKTIDRPARPDWQILCRALDLTPSEARFAARLATGESLETISAALRITKETARSSLKLIFRKTDVHRQGELVALLTSLLRSK